MPGARARAARFRRARSVRPPCRAAPGLAAQGAPRPRPDSKPDRQPTTRAPRTPRGPGRARPQTPPPHRRSPSSSPTLRRGEHLTRRGARELDLRRLLLRFSLLRFDAAADFDSAARIYRRCRAAGFTPRGMVDCMIAAIAWRHGASLLAQDVDLQRLGQIAGIELD